MKNIDIDWTVEDGYATGDRPQSFSIDPSECEGLTHDEIVSYVTGELECQFNERVSWSCDIEDAVERIEAALDGGSP